MMMLTQPRILLMLGGLVAAGVLCACKNPTKQADSGLATPASNTAALGNPAVSASAKGASGVLQPPYNVLLLSIDSLRADMPWAGYPRDIAPHLKELESRSVSYSRGYAISSFTSKSLGGFLGGRLPSELERTAPFFTKYLPSNVMFPEALTAQGIHTFAGHAHAYMDKGLAGFEQGFESFRVVTGIPFDYNTDPHITSQKMTPMAIEMLRDPKLTSERFFGWFHYMDPHERYQGHEESPHWGPRARDKYDEEVFYTDLWIHKLLEFVEQQPWAKKTVIVVTADHAEAFGEHNMTRHAFELYEMLVHVPLFLYIPGVPARRIEAPRSHIDLIPTLFELMGAKANPELRGKSFASELTGGAVEARDVMCDLPEDSFNERRRTLLHDDWKLIAFGNDARYELYNLKVDPDESTNLIKKETERAKEMIDRYKEANLQIREAPIKGGIKKHKDKQE